MILLIHDPAALSDRIAEALSEAKVNMERLTVEPALSDPSPHVDQSVVYDDNDSQIETLRQGLELIDPENVTELMAILLSRLKESEIERAANDAVYRAIKYHDAVTLLGPVSRPAQIEEAVSPVTELDVESEAEDSGSVSSMDLIPASDIKLDSLARLPTKHIIAHLHGERGNAVLRELGCPRPTEATARELASYIINLDDMTASKRASDIVAKVVQATGVSLELFSAVVDEEISADEVSLWI
jgi:hypothetical protein